MTVEERLAALYAEVPEVNCKGKCWQSCGPIGMALHEARRIEVVTGDTLKLAGDDLKCAYLIEHRCTVYADRPLICRLWGAVEDMPCPHGCKPERYLSPVEARSLLNRATAISGGNNVYTMPGGREALRAIRERFE